MSLTPDQIQYLDHLYERIQKLTLDYNKVSQYIKSIKFNKQKEHHYNNFMNMILTLSNSSKNLFPLSEDLDKKWEIQVMLTNIVIYTDDNLLIWRMIKDVILNYEVVDINVIKNNIFLKAFDDEL